MSPTLRRVLEASLTRFPSLYARLIAGRPHANLDKIVFLSLLRRGDAVADIGANVGYYSLLFSRLVGARGGVHSFEPAPATFDELEAAVRGERRSGNVILNRCALSDAEATTTLYLPGDDHGQASLARHTAGSWGREAPIHAFPCRVTTLDHYAESRALAALSFIKCDVEGAELPVLRGGQETIRRFTPLLYLEVSRHWSADFAYEPADILRFLEPLGYDRFWLVTDRISPVLAARQELDPARLPDAANLLCAHGGHARRLARLRAWLPAPVQSP